MVTLQKWQFFEAKRIVESNPNFTGWKYSKCFVWLHLLHLFQTGAGTKYPEATGWGLGSTDFKLLYLFSLASCNRCPPFCSYGVSLAIMPSGSCPYVLLILLLYCARVTECGGQNQPRAFKLIFIEGNRVSEPISKFLSSSLSIVCRLSPASPCFCWTAIVKRKLLKAESKRLEN